MRPHRKYSIAGRRFEDVLRHHRDRQIAELRAENECLRARLEAAEAALRQLKEGGQ